MRQVLSISSFKKYALPVVKIAIVLVCFGTVVSWLNTRYWQTDAWSRIVWHSFYQQDHIENLYLGSSHVYCDLDPTTLDELNGQNNFNLSTSAQRLQESYYNLLEADRLYDLENVYVELYYVWSTGDGGDYSKTSSLQVGWRNTDYMNLLSPVRYLAVCNMNDNEHYLDALLPFLRGRAYLFDADYITARISEKEAEDYQNYCYTSERDNYYIRYDPKGDWETNREYDLSAWSQSTIELVLTTDAQEYLRKIIEYCQSHDLTLTLFCSPIYEVQIMSAENYDSYVDSVTAIAQEYNVPFYDFNLCKGEYLPIQKPENFSDIGHLNNNGSDLFTRFFYRVVTGNAPDNEIYFYDTYTEKLASEPSRLYGMYLLAARDEENRRVYELAAGSKNDIEFRVTSVQTDEDGNETSRLLQDFSTNRQFAFTDDEHGTLTVEWRLTNEPSMVEEMEFTY